MLSNVDFEKLKQIIRDAGAVIMEEYVHVDTTIEYKKDNSPLTKADERSDEVINDGLRSLNIQFPIISEESKRLDPEKRMNIETFWLVDPLDGTKEFINKNGEFAVCIALIHKNKSILGMIYAPVLDELYYAQKGKGAFMEKGEEVIELKANQISLDQKGLRMAVSRSHINVVNDDYIKKFQDPVLVPKGSVLKMTDIARGLIDIYPRLDEKTQEWDIAAGQIIVEESGGTVLLEKDQQQMGYNKPALNNHAFVARAMVI